MSSNDDNENKNENENDKTLMSSNDENEDDETMDQNKKNIIIKGVNDVLDKIIDKSKSFEDQIKSIKKQKIQMGFIFSTILVIKSQNLNSLN